MALRVVRGPDTPHRIVIACEACGVEVDDRKIAKRGGLLEMGWLRRFNPAEHRNEYFCPKHKKD